MTTKIKLFLTDVDGVMTDAGMYYTESGDEFKKFNTHDGMAFNLLREAGIKTGMITTETTKSGLFISGSRVHRKTSGCKRDL